MNKNEILILIDQKHSDLLTFLSNHSDDKWNQGPDGKWTTGQHIIHLTQSTKALNKALRLPKFFLQYKFGKANRGPRSYAEVIDKYHAKLSKAGNVVSPFSQNMPDTPISGKQTLIDALTAQKELQAKRLSKLSEKQLDKYLIPHPLMGRMLLREIISWNAYHTEHHKNILVEKY